MTNEKKGGKVEEKKTAFKMKRKEKKSPSSISINMQIS